MSELDDGCPEFKKTVLDAEARWKNFKKKKIIAKGANPNGDLSKKLHIYDVKKKKVSRLTTILFRKKKNPFFTCYDENGTI